MAGLAPKRKPRRFRHRGRRHTTPTTTTEEHPTMTTLPIHGPRVGRGAPLQIRYRTYRTVAQLDHVAAQWDRAAWHAADDGDPAEWEERIIRLELEARDTRATRADLAAAIFPDLVDATGNDWTVNR